MNQFNVVSSYIQDALAPDTRARIIEDAMEKLEPIADTFDAVAFQGMSGAVIAPIIADRLGKGLIFVRKGDSFEELGYNYDRGPRHSNLEVEGVCGEVRYLIVDDFIAGGNTVQRIALKIWEVNRAAKCVGIYLWRASFFQHKQRWINDHSGTVPVYCTRESDSITAQGRLVCGWDDEEVFDGSLLFDGKGV
jgi:adenine/guanine phosphoribosyltransferase-like PRPP-binding protein